MRGKFRIASMQKLFFSSQYRATWFRHVTMASTQKPLLFMRLYLHTTFFLKVTLNLARQLGICVLDNQQNQQLR